MFAIEITMWLRTKRDVAAKVSNFFLFSAQYEGRELKTATFSRDDEERMRREVVNEIIL
jgi:hypothetical protein